MKFSLFPVLRPAAIYIVAMLAIAFLWGAEWRTADWFALRSLSGRSPATFAPNVLLGNLEGYDGKNTRSLRASLARFFRNIASLPNAEQPDNVVLDVEFDGSDKSRATADLVGGIRLMSKTKVYVAKDPPFEFDSLGSVYENPGQAQEFQEFEDSLESRIYNIVPAGHTWFETIDGSNAIAYQECISYYLLHAERHIDALPLLVDGMSKECSSSAWQVVLLGSNAHVPDKNLGTLRNGQWRGPPLADATVILGALKLDKGKYRDVTSPELLAWAISENAPKGAEPRLVVSDALLPLVTLGTSICAVAVFLGIFMPLRRRSTHYRLSIPLISACISVAATLLLFAAFEVTLRWSSVLLPQVTLPSSGILVATAVAVLWARQTLLTDQLRRDARPVDVIDYDVFISYTHSDASWMLKNIYGPLCKELGRPGEPSPHSVFYDKNRGSLIPGEAWIDKLMLSIDHSRFVIALCSDGYFSEDHPWCLAEFRRAYGKWIISRSDPCVFVLLRRGVELPAAFRDIEFVAIDDDPSALADIITQIVSRIRSGATT